MKRLLVICCALIVCLWAQAQYVSMKEIASGKYREKGVYGLNSMKDGDHYTRLSDDHKQILRYAFKTGKQVDVLFDVEKARGEKLEYIDGYTFSPDEQLILLRTQTKSVYRHSYTAEHYIYNVKNNKMEPLSTAGPQQVPLFSPDGTQIAFVRKNNIYLVKLLFDNAESQVTKDGEFNKVINGIPDWVYEEEFAYNRAFTFSADSKMIAYVRFDESAVQTYNFPLYRGQYPVHEGFADYPGSYSYKYPKAGYANSKVSVHTFDIKSQVTRKVDVPLGEEDYIPRIRFTSDPDKLAIVTLNRHQNKMDVYIANPRSLVCKLTIRDEDSRYINEGAYGEMGIYNDHIVLMSERDGYNHLYLYNLSGQLLRQITKGKDVVRDFLGYNEATGDCYYTTTDGNPLQSIMYKIDAKGRKTKLSQREGTNRAVFSAGFKFFINTFSDVNTPAIVTIHDNKGKEVAKLLDNEDLQRRLVALKLPKKEFFKFQTSEGVELNGVMMKPADFDPSKKYPVIFHQYSGPGSQKVLNQWRIGATSDGGVFESYFCNQGFIMVCVDGRGTGGRGADFEKCTYLQLGVREAKDQVEAAKYMASLPYIDGNRIGIWGWSFGGYMTLMSMSEGSGVFKAGVAVAAPTDWRFYDSVYTERFMRTPKENKEGYDMTSAINRAGKLAGELLLIHGTADDNVHYQNMAEYTEALVQAGIPYRSLVYTNRDHFIRGGNTTAHLYEQVAHHFLTHLK